MNDRDNLYRLSKDEVDLLHMYRRLSDQNQFLIMAITATATEQAQIDRPKVVPFLPALHA